MPSSARRPPYLAHLRAFEPVAHLREPDRGRWTMYAADAPDRRALEASAFTELVRRLAASPPVPLPAVESPDALVLEVDDALYVSPLQPRLQAWRGLGDSEELVAAGALGAVLPLTLRDQALADLAEHSGSDAEQRLFSRTATWEVPIAWFVLFEPAERRLELAGERALRYRTSMSDARRRAARGLRAVRENLGASDVLDDLEQVARWLEEFDPRSLVELDYGGLVDLLDDAHLRGDDSASDVADGMAALAEEDVTGAAAAYQRLSTRWQRVLLLARSS